MKTTTSVKSGGLQLNHNQSTAGVKVQSHVKAGEGGAYQGKRSTGGYVPT